MRRAILFLVFALFLAMVIQPNLNKQIKEKSKIDVPEQTNSTIITNDTVDNSRCKSKAVISVLMQVMEVVMQDIQVMDRRVKKI
ncbi:MAG: hypothetical protein ACLTTH_11175 [Holdemanella porci]